MEPVSFHLLRLEDLPEWQDVEALSQAVLDPVARGDDKTAAAAFRSYWLGRWRWWIAPERFKNAIAATIPKVALEFSIAIDAKRTALDYANQAPTCDESTQLTAATRVQFWENAPECRKAEGRAI